MKRASTEDKPIVIPEEFCLTPMVAEKIVAIGCLGFFVLALVYLTFCMAQGSLLMAPYLFTSFMLIVFSTMTVYLLVKSVNTKCVVKGKEIVFTAWNKKTTTFTFDNIGKVKVHKKVLTISNFKGVELCKLEATMSNFPILLEAIKKERIPLSY